MSRQSHPWIKDEIVEGFQLLVTLSMDGQPARDVLEYTVRTWVSVIARELGNPDEEIDVPRIRHAFTRICRRGKRWPAPQDFFDALPPRPPLRRIEPSIPESTPEERLQVKRLINQLLEELDGKTTCNEKKQT
ncbi:hypothetical protein P9J64_00540 [Deltaproteobacteria bacterium IMCC39524]|nr:hypothetical protein [Deltaproteobacteria bacterium IMCC39524]